METHVHGSRHDERYKCVEMQYQNIDNQGARSCNQTTHMKRNENPIYDYYMDAKRESRNT
jgi:hypothetical protein